jgi:hypothetical protein
VRDEELLLARARLGEMAKAIGVTPTGERYFPSWFSTEIVGKALDLQYAHLMGRSYGVRRVAVQQPTQTGKSYHTSELWPAVLTARRPSTRVVIAGYGNEFMTRTLPNVRAISQTSAFRSAYPDIAHGSVDGTRAADNLQKLDVLQRRLGKWHRAGGYILARSFAGAVNGNAMDAGIIEDPYKDWAQALSAAETRRRRDFFTGVFTHRQQSRRSIQTIAVTPWTPTDISAFVVDQWEKDKEPYLVLKFPMFQRADSARELLRWRTSPAMREGLAKLLGVDAQALDQIVQKEGLRPYDKRPLGYPLLPFKDRDVEFYEQIRRSQPPRDFAALCQMDPESAAFERFPRQCWRVFSPRTHRLNRVVISVDANGAETVDGSFAVFGVYDVHPVKVAGDGKLDDLDPVLQTIDEGRPALPYRVYRLDEARARPRYGDLLGMALQTLDRWPECTHLIVEGKAAGNSLVGDYRLTQACERRGVAITVTQPKGDKGTRSGRAEIPQRNGYCFVPGENYGRYTCSWLHDDPERLESGEGLGFLSEMSGDHAWDDRRDEFSQLIDQLQEPGSLDLFSGWNALAAFA